LGAGDWAAQGSAAAIVPAVSKHVLSKGSMGSLRRSQRIG